MKNTRLTIAFFVVCTFISSASANIPVIDTTSIANMVQQLNALNKQINALKAQIDIEVGDTGFSKFLDQAIKQMHSYQPDSLDNLEDIIKDGAGVNGLKQLAVSLKTKHQQLSADDLFREDNNLSKAYFNKKVNELYGAFAVAQNTYDGAGRRKSSLDQLRQAISNAQSPKEREQLLLRITAENSLLLNEITQMLAFDLLVRQQERATALNRDSNTKKAAIKGIVPENYEIKYKRD